MNIPDSRCDSNERTIELNSDKKVRIRQTGGQTDRQREMNIEHIMKFIGQ